MNFNDQQSKKIYDFIVKYNSDEKFKNDTQKLYTNNPEKLSMLYIYAIEEILRFGNNNIYKEFMKKVGNNSDHTTITQYDQFVKYYNENKDFKIYKQKQLSEQPETLSQIEKFALFLLKDNKEKIKHEKEKDEPGEQLEYDPLNEILYETDDDIKMTLGNLTIGQYIHELLKIPQMKSIKDRQIRPGQIANIDKPLVIKLVKRSIIDNEKNIRNILNQRYAKTKFNILLDKKDDAFKDYLKFNTNISVYEILTFNNNNDYNNSRKQNSK